MRVNRRNFVLSLRENAISDTATAGDSTNAPEIRRESTSCLGRGWLASGGDIAEAAQLAAK